MVIVWGVDMKHTYLRPTNTLDIDNPRTLC